MGLSELNLATHCKNFGTTFGHVRVVIETNQTLGLVKMVGTLDLRFFLGGINTFIRA